MTGDLPRSMRALLKNPESGKPPIVETVPVPAPGPGEVLIRVRAAALNRADLLQAIGLYPPPPGASQVLGLECAGEVATLGDGVTLFKPGDQVMALVAGGGQGEFCVADQGSCLAVPPSLTMIEAGATPEALFTVYTNVVERAGLKPGERFLVHGGASGIGTWAIQMFALKGHEVFATAGGPEKTALCLKLGAKHAIDYKTQDFVEAVRAATGGQGVDVILDMVGGDYVERNLKALALEGRLVNIAYQNGAQVALNLMPVMLKRLTITGSTLRARTAAQKAAIAAGVKRDFLPLIAEGRLRPVIDSVLPLDRAAEAHARMGASTHAGKIVLTMDH